ncbi:hypothetical protein D3C87_1952010 [compost metagenome]
MNELQLAALRQILQVAADRLSRHVEVVGKLSDADRAVGSQTAQNLAMTARGKGSGVLRI